jgi:hypothetical protein
VLINENSIKVEEEVWGKIQRKLEGKLKRSSKKIEGKSKEILKKIQSRNLKKKFLNLEEKFL